MADDKTGSRKLTDDEPLIKVTGLGIARRDGQTLLRDTNFELAAGEIVVLAGPSGSGKSTLVNLLSGSLDDTDEGWEVAGTVSAGGRSFDLAQEHVALGGVVFQNFALFDELTVGENLAIASEHNAGLVGELKHAIDQLLVGVDRDASVYSCSGGQRQRVAIARTLLARRAVLFLDEPNSGLDVVASRRLADLIRDLVRELGTPVVIIAHHFRNLLDIADRVIVLDPSTKTLETLPAELPKLEKRLTELTGVGAEEAPTAPSTAGARVRGLARVFQPRKPAAWRAKWMGLFLWGYIWELCLTPSSLLFVGLGSVIIGFVTTWFVFQYLPFRDLLLPVIHSDALAGLAFTELRVMAPLVAAVLATTRNAALIGANVGHKVYSDQIKAMRNLNVPHGAYLTANVLIASAVASIILVAASVCLTGWVAMATWAYIFPEMSTHLWRDQYFQRLWPPDVPFMVGIDWIAAKAIPSITGAAMISLYFGYRPKTSVIDINNAIAQSLIWGLSFVLSWQSILTLIEFKYVSKNLEVVF
ncbi:MAG: ATP-binding cassette domain-containing protein [Rhodospirillaceae bacterium]|jgi:ABC-type multidrug transport system ATPase subunit/ABC-type transporter Mla maintaining outer membrane lipid asymmetry permease subunit MlaE|nr:ATP-binding cassette domain-containing protein [Rhodospirillaceae bacterium]MBT6136960.1 ATP-binding cassette domain-containing protein [Rhodospirillaceae bacterium]